MIRHFAAPFALLLLAAGFAAASPLPRPSVTITGTVIRLGDLFTEAGAHADDVVAPAPALGTRMIVDANWLAAAAREHGLTWTPASDLDRVSIERASRVIGADALVARLLTDLAPRGSDDSEIQLDNPGIRLLVPAESSDTIAVDGMNFDERSGRFSAFVSAPPGDPGAARQRIAGHLIRMSEVPVLNRAVSLGEVIVAADIDHIKLRRDRIGPDSISDAAQLVGKSARHSLRAQQPLRSMDVQEPILVHKGDLVTLRLETPLMQLSTQAKALEDGTLGATIRVANTQSSRTIEVAVTGPDSATVANPAPPARP